jgi:acyl dehydratase
MTNKFSIGQSASITKTFSEKDVDRFAHLSEDRNPVHLDEEYAKSSIFAKRIVHGMLTASLFSGLLGEKLPGKGTIYLGQELKFTAPVPIGEKIIATVEIIKIREDKPIITLRTYCKDSKDNIVIDGEAVVLVPKN